MDAALPSYDAARRAAWAAVLCLPVIYLLLIKLQSDGRLWRDAAAMWLPPVLAVAVPCLTVAVALTVRVSALSLALAIATSAGVMTLFALSVVRAGSGESGLLNLLTGVLFFNVTLLAFAGFFVPAQLWLFLRALSAYRALPGTSLGWIPAAGVLAFGYVHYARSALAPVASRADEHARRTSYSSEPVERQLRRIYECLWRQAGPRAVNGFPAALEAIHALRRDCYEPDDAPDGASYGTYYDMVYRPGPPEADGRIRSFVLMTKRRTARGNFTDSRYLDERGVFRTSSVGWADRSTRVESYARTFLTAFRWVLEEYRAKHPEQGYPLRVLGATQVDSARPGDLVYPNSSADPRVSDPRVGAEYVRDATHGDSVSVLRVGTVERLYGPPTTITYRPMLAADGTVRSYTLDVRSGERGLRDYRSYFVAADGRIHATGEDRAATATDPLVVPGELDAQHLYGRAPKERWAWLAGAPLVAYRE